MISVQLGSYTPSSNKAEYIDITLGIFFDGTKNNKTNTNEREKNTSAFKENGADDDESSYYNDWTNVARLWDQYDKSSSLYIEGIGTEDKEKDDLRGYAFGSGSTGIRAKVRKACEKIVSDKLSRIIRQNPKKKLRSINFDVFGFSRGAAAARNFVYEIGKSEYKAEIVIDPDSGITSYYDSDGDSTNLEVLPACGHLGLMCKNAGFEINLSQIKVRFLGIFDTVSSYSKYPIPDFNDVNELHLNEIGRAQNVVHFIAENEHRENFSLTRVNVGKERTFPGVHSDVGGSYDDGPETKKELATSWTTWHKLIPFKENLIEQCWYKEDELQIVDKGFYWALKGHREYLKKTFSYIPLHFMAKYASSYNNPINLSAIEDGKYTINDDELLVRVKNYLHDYVMANGEQYIFKKYNDFAEKYGVGSNKFNEEVQKQDDLRYLRNKYLHWSARKEGLGMDPNPDGKRIYY